MRLWCRRSLLIALESGVLLKAIEVLGGLGFDRLWWKAKLLGRISDRHGDAGKLFYETI
jgi:hypothetical protein